MKAIGKVCCPAVLLFAGPAAAQINEVEQTLSRYEHLGAPSPPSINAQSVKYGRDYWQRIQFIKAKGDDPAPLVVWVDGASYDSANAAYSLVWLPDFFHEHGFALASLWARREADASAPERAADMAAGIAELIRKAAKYRIDPSRIILIGEGSEGHFAALLAADERYLKKAGVPFESVRAAVIFNGEGFDITRRISSSSPYVARKYEKSFGKDPSVQTQLSPISHVAPPNAPFFLFHVVKDNRDLAVQAGEMAAALRNVGASVEIVSAAPTKGSALSGYIGAPQNELTEDLLAFLRRAAGMPPAD